MCIENAKYRMAQTREQYLWDLQQAMKDAILCSFNELRKKQQPITADMVLDFLLSAGIQMPDELCLWQAINYAVDEHLSAYIEFGPSSLAVIRFTDAS